jgi:hypothetical protein
MKKFLLAPALAALAMFVFGFLYWGLPNSPAYKTLSQVADDDAAAHALANIFPATGIYFIPGMHVEEARMTELIQRGPTAQVVFVKEGNNPMDPMMFIKGYLQYFVIALALMIMLVRGTPSFKCFSCRVRFAAAVGLIGALFEFTDAIWARHPLGYHLVAALYIVLECALAGLVLAKFTMTPAAPAPTPTPA